MKFLSKKKIHLAIITLSGIFFLFGSAHCSNLGIISPRESIRIHIAEDTKAFVTETRYIHLHQGTNQIYLSYPGVKIIPDSFHIQFVNEPGKIKIIQTSTAHDTPWTFTWTAYSEKEGSELIRISYLSEGLKVDYSYVGYVEEKKDYLALKGALSLINQTGEEFAGVHIVERGKQNWDTDLKREEKKRLFFFDKLLFPLKKIYILDYQNYGEKIILQYELTNTANNPVMPGKIMVYQRGKDNSLTFLGEDIFNLTNPKEKAKITVGDVQDIKVERKLIEFLRINVRRNDAGNITIYDTAEKYEIILKNQRKEKVNLSIREYIPDSWKMIESKPSNYIKEDAHHIIFEIEIMPEEEVNIYYHIQRKNLLPYQIVKPLAK
ncbi:hypothetical protein IBX65_08170 [Candidatus Aerophobetes bacterium]|nr:hypothetical protein [Candidatus Aerophobetes bacterium]